MRPSQLPLEFFVDRSLGRRRVPDALRALGLIVHTLASVYGPNAEQTVRDEVWLAASAANGWIVLTKDSGIRRRPAEIEAIELSGARVFCLTNANLRADQQIAYLITNINRIIQRRRHPGPYVYGVYESRIEKLWPKRPPAVRRRR